jgi:hypothetical protein
MTSMTMSRACGWTLFTATAIFGSVPGARADTGFGWLSCEAGGAVPDKLVVSAIFPFDYHYDDGDAEGPSEFDAEGMDAEQAAAEMARWLDDRSSRAESFEPQVEAALGARFHDRVGAELGVACLIEETVIDFRKEFDGVVLELVEVSFTP